MKYYRLVMRHGGYPIITGWWRPVDTAGHGWQTAFDIHGGNILDTEGEILAQGPFNTDDLDFGVEFGEFEEDPNG